MVTGQEPESPGIKGKRVVETVLRREVCNRKGSPFGVLFRKPAIPVCHVLVKTVHNDVITAQVFRVRKKIVKKFSRNFLEHFYGIMDTFFPCLLIDLLEEYPCLRVPAPPEIVCQIDEAGQPLGDLREFLHQSVMRVGHRYLPGFNVGNGMINTIGTRQKSESGH